MTEPRRFAVQKYSANAVISRERAILLGIFEPTPEEVEQAAEKRRQLNERRRRDWAIYQAAVSSLAAIDDPAARLVLDLHSRSAEEYPDCQGCDVSGYDAEQPAWPCRTVEAIAAHYGIPLPELMSKPEETFL